MAFTIPNRPDTGIEADQAEPDKGDFLTLGYQKSGVLSGGVTTKTSDNSVSVAAISGYLNGEYFNITSASNRGAFTPPATGLSKFVLIVVAKAGGNFSVGEIEGTTANNGQSATNTRYPEIDTTTQMLVAAVYYANGDTVISPNAIVDKRVFVLPQANPTAVTSDPGDIDIGALGEIRVNTSSTLTVGETNVWVKTKTTGSDRWTQLAGYTEQIQPDPVVVADPTAKILHHRTDTGVVIGGSDTSNDSNKSGGVTYALLVDGASKIAGNLTVSGDLVLGSDTVTAKSKWPLKRSISLVGEVTGSSEVVVDGSDNVTISSTTVSGYLPLTGSYALVDGAYHSSYPLTGTILTTHVVPSAGGYDLGTIFLRYRDLYLGNQPDVSSDVALKQDFTDAPGLPFLKDLKPMSYRLKTHPDDLHWGFVAQDVEQSCDEHGIEDAAVYSKVDGADMTLKYGELMAPMVKAIQELSERLEAIENG